MKKMFMVLIIALMCAVPFGAEAAVGDVAGLIYSTDIMAYINDMPIESYNIGGRTCVIVEDFYQYRAFLDSVSYGIDWEYNDAERLLTAHSTGIKGYGNVLIDRGEVGRIAGKIYETDIKVMFNDKEVQGYNIGGRTAVCIEDLGTVYEDGKNRDYGYSDYMCRFTWDNDKREVKLYTYMSENEEFIEYIPMKVRVDFNDNNISFDFDQMNGWYGARVSHGFSDEFMADTYKIKPIYYNGDVVGTMYVSPTHTIKQMDRHKIYKYAKDIATVLTHKEATEYIKENFVISDTYENDYADYYLGKKGEANYLLVAVKPAGFVAWPQDEDAVFKKDETGKIYLSSYTAGPPGTGIVEVSFYFTDLSYGFYDWKSDYEDAIAELTDRYNADYTIENDKYFVLMDKAERCVVAVNKEGEYTLVADIGLYDEESNLELSFLEEDVLNINISPFGTMGGENSIDIQIDFKMYEFKAVK